MISIRYQAVTLTNKSHFYDVFVVQQYNEEDGGEYSSLIARLTPVYDERPSDGVLVDVGWRLRMPGSDGVFTDCGMFTDMSKAKDRIESHVCAAIIKYFNNGKGVEFPILMGGA